MKGPSTNSSVIYPTIVQESLSIFFLGNFTIELSGLISHLSPLVFHVNAYLLIGNEDFLYLGGLILLNFGIYNFWVELSNTEDDKKLVSRPYLLFFFFGVGLMIVTTLQKIGEFEEMELIYIFYGITLLYTGLNIIGGYRTRTKQDKVIDLRKKLTVWCFFFINFFVITVDLAFIPKRGQLPSQYPTRNPSVELFILSNDLDVLFSLVFIYLVVYLPKFIRKLHDIDEEDFIRHTDFRFDVPNSLEIRVKFIDESYEKEYNKSMKYLMLYHSDESLIFEQLVQRYDGKIVNISQLTEEIISQLILPTSEIILIDAHFSRTSENIFKDLNRYYLTSLNYTKEGIIFRNNYRISSVKNEFALISIVPSFWNLNRKFWLVNIKPIMALVIIDFLHKFKEYLEDLARSKQIVILALRFPYIEGELQPIPSLTGTSDIPHEDYIEFLM